MRRRGPCAAERRPIPPRGGPCAAKRRPLCREEAPVPRGGPCAERSPLCRKVFCAERIGGGPVSGGFSCAERRPSLLVGPVLCARGLKEAPVSGGCSLCRMVRLLYAKGTAGGPYAERRPSVPGGPLC